MKTTAEKFCVVCFALSAFLPWALMVTAAALALFIAFAFQARMKELPLRKALDVAEAQAGH